MRTLRARAAPLSAALAACLSGTVIGQTRWTEVRGDHVTLRGTLEPGRLQPVACEVRQALRALGAPRDDESRPSVVAAAGEKEMRELLPRYWERRGPRPLGAYWSGPHGHHIAVRIDAPREQRVRRLFHELAHFATRLAHANPPRWFDEGISELWEHAALGADRIEIGGPVPAHLKALRSDASWMPMADLLSAEAVPEHGRGTKASVFYAQSWALVHYFLFVKAAGTPGIDRLPQAEAYPTGDELRRYIRGTLPRPISIVDPALSGACAEPLESRSLSHVETRVLKARALADGERPDAALPVLREALRAEPENSEALETLGVVHFLGNRPRESAAVFDRLIARKQGSHLAYYYRAVLAEPVPDLADGSGPVPAIDYLREAIRRRPAFRPAHDRLRELQGKSTCCAGSAVVKE